MTTHLKDFSAPEDPGAGQKMTHLLTHSSKIYKNYFKRLFDIAFVLLTAPIGLPLIALMALIVARDGASPFYWQPRVGRNGNVFRMLKIRTMVPNADACLEEHLEKNQDARAEWESSQKLKDDPRITAAGNIMRKSSLDELPQLWNVLCGDMSIVGPRPMMVDQKPLYPGSAYYALRPGITGPWQVSDRNNCTFAERAKFDTEYSKKLSLKTDIIILVQTAGVVLKCTGY
ncbi:sugar transferase [Pseudohalocynthiibacter sp. F2068]|jgi:exopolysaccharide production protein ExoY|uniref:sugar transferase n=1 Tax=Pseudohalocynthiibacter sp. F2068 TaxID=2926418 RepID=UPI001FF34567|nr:sugar transferase [Pseudohalocynthiibacter sp. F2068]MCK0103871.1 sugar transferase [Pseudohalocynthiibacter sp. F2068]